MTRFYQTPEDFDLIITDMAMPGMSGDRFARQVRQIRPRLPVILCTGYSDLINEKTVRESDVSMVVNKPLGKTELARIVSHVLANP